MIKKNNNLFKTKILNKKKKIMLSKVIKGKNNNIKDKLKVNIKNNYIWKNKNKLNEKKNNIINSSLILFKNKNKINYTINKKTKNINKNYNLNNKIYKHIKNNKLLNNNKINLININNKKNKKNIYKKIYKTIIIKDNISIYNLSKKLSEKISKVTKIIINMGFKINKNKILDKKIAKLIIIKMGHKVIINDKNKLEKEIIFDNNIYKFKIEKNRPPIVTVMGHVDHGKTSLLDYIRSTKIAMKEIGGITQKISAYNININNNNITFLDTPGHNAFNNMRYKISQITDIIILVIASDDGIMPQTIEVIKYIKYYSIPIIIAINKIDKIESNPNRIKNELSKYKIISQEWGGNTQFINISAKTGKGIKNLLNSIVSQSKLLKLKVIYNKMANGVVIESYIDKNRGPITIVLIKEGTLKINDNILCGSEYGKVKAMRNDLGKNIILATPSLPIEILGLSGITNFGDKLYVINDEKKAKKLSLLRKNELREKKLYKPKKENIENIFNKINNNNILKLNIIIKSDTNSSLEVIENELKKILNNNIIINIISSSVGIINDTDIILAKSSNAIIISFNIKNNIYYTKNKQVDNLNIRYYNVIYTLIKDVKKIMNNMLLPQHKKKIIGIAYVRNVFNISKFNLIAGCIITEGIFKKNNKIQILRNNTLIYKCKLNSLRRFKDDVNEVYKDMECGIGIKNYKNICIGDKIESYKDIEIKQNIIF